MSASRATPKQFPQPPWRVEADLVVDANGQHICTVREVTTSDVSKTLNLIAAAPDLFAALGELVLLKDDVKARDEPDYQRRKEPAWEAAREALRRILL